jgi:hypothetical protein
MTRVHNYCDKWRPQFISGVTLQKTFRSLTVCMLAGYTVLIKRYRRLPIHGWVKKQQVSWGLVSYPSRNVHCKYSNYRTFRIMRPGSSVTRLVTKKYVVNGLIALHCMPFEVISIGSCTPFHTRRPGSKRPRSQTDSNLFTSTAFSKQLK